MQKRITLTINGQKVAFDVDTPTYDMYLNELTLNNKVAPARTFCMRSVASEDKAALRTVLEQPGAGLQIAARLLEEFTPDLEIELGE